MCFLVDCEPLLMYNIRCNVPLKATINLERQSFGKGAISCCAIYAYIAPYLSQLHMLLYSWIHFHWMTSGLSHQELFLHQICVQISGFNWIVNKFYKKATNYTSTLCLKVPQMQLLDTPYFVKY